MTYRGDFALGVTLDFKFTTVDSTGLPTTLAGTPSVACYPDNSTTEITAGITLTVDFDSRTGLHNVRIVATSGNGYATATNYEVVVTAGTVGGVSVVGYVVGAFSIENRSALRPATAGRTLVVDANGLADANTVKLGPTGSGTAQTARDIGASVLLSSGTGTGQLDFTSGVVKANLAQILGTALTETAGLLAGAFKKFFNVATPTGTVNSIPDAVAGAAGGLMIAGSNAATTVNITGNITGNLSGSVGSVTGAVGSVTGAVGSVTGNVGGNVTGSVGSVAGNVGGNVTGSVGSVAAGGIAAASFAAGAIDATAIANGAIDAATFAAGAIDAAAIATNAIDADALAADAVAEIADGVWDELIAGHLGAGSTGAALNAAGSAGDPWATALPGAYGAGTAGNIVGTNLDAAVSTRSTYAGGAVASVTGNVGGNVNGNVVGSVGSVTGAVGSVTGAVGSVTGNVGGNVAGSVGSIAANGLSAASIAANAITAAKIATDAITSAQLAASAANEIADAVLDRADAIETGITLRQAERVILSATAGKSDGFPGNPVHYRDTSDTKDRITATTDADGNRTAVTLDVS